MLLGGYAAFQCPVRTHWDHVPGARLDLTPEPALKRRLEAGDAFEARAFAALVAAHGTEAAVAAGDTTRQRVDQTVAAMEEGRLLVIGGQLPHDTDGHRVGKPDVLLRVTDPGQKPGYVPVDVKHYQQFGDALKRTPRKESLARISTLDDPAVVRDAPQVSATSPNRFKAALQLAHYTRMLEACGFHPGPDWLVGGVIGTSDLRGLVPEVDEMVGRQPRS